MKFKKLREKKFERLTDFASAVGENISTVSMWETGKSSPRTKNIFRIAKTLGVSVEEVVACFTENDSERA